MGITILRPNSGARIHTIKGVAVGASGAGKTTWLASTPRPLYAITKSEQKDASTIQRINPDATVVPVNSWQEFRELWELVKMAGQCEIEGPDGQPQPACFIEVGGQRIEFQTFVGDGFTDLQRMMLARTLGLKYEDHDVLNFEAATRNLAERDWGRVLDACELVWRETAGLPCNAFWSFLAETKFVASTEGAAERPFLLPAMYGKKAPFRLSGYFNVGGYFTTRQAGTRIEHVARWSMPGGVFCKGLHGWPQVTASSPVDRTGRLTTPGQTTLGSLLRWSFPDGQVAWAEGDDAAHVEGQLGAPVGDIATPPAAVGAPAPAADKPERRRRRRS
jgi:hypothetical protein